MENLAKVSAVSRTEDIDSLPRCQEMKNYSRALKELYHAVSHQPGSGLGWDDSISGGEDELSNRMDDLDETNILWTETDVTLPSNLMGTSSSFEMEPSWFNREEMRDQMRSPTSTEQVYQEMIQIYKKLQVRAAELYEREQELKRREKLFLKHQGTLSRLRTVEEDILDRINAMQQQHQQETEQLRAALKEKNKEIKRMKSSFDSIKELNDTMKKQLNEMSEQNTMLEKQARKVQARLENLQRKHEYCVAHKSRENVVPKSCDHKPSNQDKPQHSNKASKNLSSSTTVKLLTSLMDWIVVGPPFLCDDLKAENEFDLCGVPHLSLHERCSKVLPVLVEQLYHAEPVLQLPLLRFIYCSLTELELNTQHLLLTSTLRRLGEEINRKSPLFLRSSCLHTRFLSSIIILKTISQADIVAQALEVLHSILGGDEGRGLFLKYKALPTILTLLRTGSPGLLATSLDVLLQMSSGSRHLSAFLDACSTDQFFRCTALLLRNQRLDLAIAEKLSVLLQKLSGIRKNRRLFEASSLHLLLQQMQRSSDPARAFLNINLSSVLFNLGMNTHS
ncbi:coiled-coil domain-containing protein 138-like isoform X2 [Trichomycterus rosablanca]